MMRAPIDLPLLVQGAQVRTFAEATLQKPDIPVHGIQGRYAMALFEAGAKQGHLDKIDEDLKSVCCIFALKAV